jgi:hypothetical protein
LYHFYQFGDIMKYSFFSPIALSFLLTLTSLGFSKDVFWETFNDSWDAQLKKYVKNGKVDYANWAKDKQPLNEYLASLKNLTPEKMAKASREDSLAMYINAYNAYTVDIMNRNLGIKSIRDISPNAWKQKFVYVEGEQMSLDDLEHKIIRPVFKEPLIHFAIVCASISCPPLVNDAYTGSNLMKLMEQNTRTYLADSEQNDFSGKKNYISKLFKWFKSDFHEGDNTVESFIQKYGPENYDPSKSRKYKKYDWGTNSL